MALDLPFFGNLVLCTILVMAAYTFAMAAGAGRGRPNMLVAARWGTYATCALVAVDVLLLAYAFQAHDFRIRYVARYSDRSMGWGYLLTSLWGGQDGSLLWWSFLLCCYTAACTRWMRGRYLELQPWVLATLMTILGFFVILMLFAANPFATFPAQAPVDGEGLNPLLQNYWMTIHPPSLYTGFTGWSVPFAFVVAALMTGRLHEEWIHATRRWALIAWTFLSIGLLLGMLWSYEELGWGGYWAWDPVENASFMPWLVATAYLHSVMVQERLRMLKAWNVFLLCLTFLMTIFGTFLTRAGLIASVHAFAKSDIGIWFVWYMAIVAVGVIVLMAWRWKQLQPENRIQHLLSREFAFLFNNWVLIGMMVFVLAATTFPLFSEWLESQKVTVGPSFYDKWMVPFSLVLVALMGIGPLIAWRKATGKNLIRAFRWPLVAAGVMGLVHVFVGPLVGFPATIQPTLLADTPGKTLLEGFYSVAPLLSSTLCVFVLATIVQEFGRGVAARMRGKGENPLLALGNLVSRSRRRYGGYIIHVGIVLMYLGFTGAGYDVEKEASLSPGETMEVGGFRIRYDRPHMELDREKRMLFTDMTVMNDDGKVLGKVSPAKFIYKREQQATTEVSIRSRPVEDLYVIMSTVDPQTERGTFQVKVRPLVAWIWVGGLVLLFGSLTAMWPSARELVSSEEEEKS